VSTLDGAPPKGLLGPLRNSQAASSDTSSPNGLLSLLGFDEAVHNRGDTHPVSHGSKANGAHKDAVDSSTVKSVIATCPAGKQIIGGGGRLTLATGEVSITHLAPTATADGYEARAYEDPDGFAGNWGLVVTAICANTPAWAICANVVPGYTVVATVSVIDSSSPKTHTAACPAGRSVHGVGFLLSAIGIGEVFLNAVVPNPLAPLGTAVPVVASEDQGGVAGNWGLRTYAICAT